MKPVALKEKLNSVGDAELKNIIMAVCVASGIDKEKTDSLISDIPKLRESIMKTEDGQLEKLIYSLGKRDVEGMIKNYGTGI